MRRSVAQHCAALFMGLLFAFVVGEPLIEHACQKHTMEQAASDRTPVDAGHDVHAEHVATSAAAHAHHATSAPPTKSSTPAPASSLPHGCDCVGQCCAVALVSGPPPAAIAFAAVVEPAPEFPILRETPAAPRAERLLPPANGPPRATTV